MKGSAIVCLFACFSRAFGEHSLTHELEKQLQPLVEEAAQQRGSAYALGLVARQASLELVAGSVDTVNGTGGFPARVGARFVWGSVTKTFTGAGILQLVAAGKLNLDDRAELYVDPMLKLARAPYQSLQELFRTDRWAIPPAVEYNASEITVLHLLSMISGIRDFDTEAFRAFQYESPNLDVSPLQILDWVHGPLMFKPGGPVPTVGHKASSMNYCSVNFILLGYILAYFSGAESWRDYDQASVVPEGLSTRMVGLEFPKSGPCERATHVHGYDQASVYAPYDVSRISCLDGWTAGNAVMPALSAAEWTRALWGPDHEVVPRSLAQEMVHFPNGSFYGLATMDMTYMNGLSFLGEYGQAVGHLGDTYGFNSIVTYFPKLDIGLAIATNHEDMMQQGPRALLCTAYNRALDVLLNQSIRHCTYIGGSYWQSGCKCDGALAAEVMI